MSYVIRRARDGAYVARPGSRFSYTRDLAKARVFASLAAAKADVCPDNEHVIRKDPP
jgi:hypothetical protein